jgi:hypothetical protein
MRKLSQVLAAALLAAVCAGCAQQAPAAPRGHAARPAASRAAAVAVPAAPVSLRLVLPARTITAGSSMTGHVIVQNNTGHAISVWGCGTLFQVALVSATYQPSVGWTTCAQKFIIKTGESSYGATLRAAYGSCSPGGAQGGLPACLPANRMPPVAAGKYQVELYAGFVFRSVPWEQRINDVITVTAG